MFLMGDGRSPDWLFKSNGNFLRSLEQMKQWPHYDPDSPAIVLYYEFSSVDTNGDRELDRDDRFTVALGQPNAPNLKEIIHNVDHVLSHTLVGSQTLALIYVSGGQVWHARYRTDTFAKLSEQAVTTIPEDVLR
jgi:hypothetical protein